MDTVNKNLCVIRNENDAEWNAICKAWYHYRKLYEENNEKKGIYSDYAFYLFEHQLGCNIDGLWDKVTFKSEKDYLMFILEWV